jgi:hypothetical protein
MRRRWDEPSGDGTMTYGEVCVRAAANTAPPTELVTALASDVEPTVVDWFWPGFIAFGALTVLEGDPGLGKSTVTLDLVARLTSGRPLPGETRAGPPAAVLIVSSEDSAAHTTVPRLLAAGADRSKVRLLIEVKEAFGLTRGPQLPDDLPLIEKLLIEDGARLLLIDPLMSMLGRDKRGRSIDAHRDQSIRVLMSALKELAQRTGAAVVVIRHLTKTTGRSAIYRGGGSIGISAAARGVLLAAKHPHDSDRRVLAVVKTNLASRPLSRAYAVTGLHAATVQLGEDCDIWADDLQGGLLQLAAPEWRLAAEWLAKELAGGPRVAGQMIWEAAQKGWTARHLDHARRRLGVTTTKTDKGWEWRSG